MSGNNLAKLRQSFTASPTRETDLETLKAAFRAHLERMVRINRARAEYLARFESLVADYNAGSPAGGGRYPGYRPAPGLHAGDIQQEDPGGIRAPAGVVGWLISYDPLDDLPVVAARMSVTGFYPRATIDLDPEFLPPPPSTCSARAAPAVSSTRPSAASVPCA